MSLLNQIASQSHIRLAKIGSRTREYRRRRFKLIPAPVQRLEDRQLLSTTFTVTSTADDGSSGTLRWAINQVNSDTGPFPDTIDFNIAGTGPFTIQPTSALPAINNPIVIDGYSEPNSSPNTLAQGDNAVILIYLNGSSASSTDGLALAGGNSVVEGLAIGNYGNAVHLLTSGGDAVTGNFLGTDPTGETAQGNGVGVLVDNVGGNTIGGASPGTRNVVADASIEAIELNGSNVTGNLIAGNYIGTDATGTMSLTNNAGVVMFNNAGTNTVGGSQAGAGNLISGNTYGGILIDAGSNDNLVQGNFIGTNAAGNAAIPNGYQGFSIVPGVEINSSSNTVGGTTPGSGNLISGNGADGIDIVDNTAQDNLVEGNLIGTDVTGTQNLGNQEGGVSIFDGASYNTIGGTAAGAGNVIANNGRVGVNVGVSSGDNCPGNAILSNSIYNDAPLGIDLGFNGVTLNTPGGHQGGPNNLQNFPVITQAVAFTGTSTAIVGTLNSGANATFTLQFFSNTTANPTGYGEGQTLLGTTTGTTNSSGNASFQFSFPIVVPTGSAISATATDSLGDTSEFAQDVLAVAGTPPVEAFNDTYYTNENTTLNVPAPGVQSNDVSADGGSFTSVLVSAPSNGTVTLNPDGSFSYTPNPSFSGLDSFTYEDVENGQDSNVATVTIAVNPLTLYVTNTLDDGSPGSLPWAINLANNDPTSLPVTIDFDIPGSGPFVIQPTTPLPAITHSVIINGYSQPGASSNTLAQGDNAAILIDLNGSNIGNQDALDIEAGNSVVEGLAINQFNHAIDLASLGGDLVSGNFLGTDTTGENNEGNSLGVFVDNVGANTIGGLTPDARNIISGNSYEGVEINGMAATGNLIAGNYIGTDATGTNRLPNGMGLEFQNNSWGNTVGGPQAGAGNLVSGNNGDAIKIDGGTYNNVIQGNLVGTDVTGENVLVNYGNGVDINGSYNTIGGTAPGSGNVLSGNSGDGIVLVFNSASYNLMEGNLIGTDITGTQDLGNSSEGINLFFSASYNTIGGTVAGAGNIIAFNQNQGVGVGFGPSDNCIGDAILSNSIFGNGNIGIDLGNDGVTLNTPGSPHSGANELQSFPVLTEAISTSVSTIVSGTINTDPNSTFTLQFFANPTADPSGYGQGQILLGSTTETTDSNGNASFQVNLPVAVPVGYAISATATDPLGDTSEFAQDILTVAPTPPVEAVDDTYYVDENATVNVPAPGVQANDVAVNGGSFTSVLVSQPSDGTLIFNSDGSFSYTPNANFSGVDSFTYQDVQDGQDSNVATVTLYVNPSPIVVTNTLDDGSPGSLPWAINLVNTDPDPQPATIDFDIPGSGPFVIQPTTLLPAVTHPVVIDGYSQAGASSNTLAQGDNAVILIDLNGSNISNQDGLDLDAGKSVIEGLAINQFQNAIHLETLGGDLVAGNFLGTDTTGENNQGNNLGVFIDNVGANTIGGLTPDARNVISGNNYEGIEINGMGATGNLIAGNFIGTDATGTNRLPNGMGLEFQNSSWGNTVGGSQAGAGNVVSGNNGDAIKIDGGTYNNVIQGNLVGTDVTGENVLVNYGNGVDINGSYNTIGGTAPGSGNVLSGNSGDGIVLVFNSASYNLMEGNLIGTDITGTQDLGNSNAGINFFFGSSYNTVGGTVAGAGNIIAFNQAQGVVVGLSSTDNTEGDAILSNSIFDNSRLGIDLGNDGVTPNSPGSPHTGPNELQSFPVLNEAVAFTGLSTVIVGSLNSDPDTTFTLQFFDSPTADPSGYGQGQTLLGTATVTTDSSGNASFQVSFPVVVMADSAISATATDPFGDTSEFAQDVLAVAGTPPVEAFNDTYFASENTTLNVPAPGVQANDVSADGGSFTSVLVSGPGNGSVTLNSDGSFSYTPNPNFTGIDSFTYEDVENGQDSNVATVTLYVNPLTLVVTNTLDDGSPGSLPWAINIANSDPSSQPVTIDFDIPGNGPFVIQATTPLPAITHSVIINGYSQPGASPNTLAQGDNAVILIDLNGFGTSNSDGLDIQASNSVVEGLAINQFQNAIHLQSAGNVVEGNYLGTDTTGVNNEGNNLGVFIDNVGANTIGGLTPDARNVISGNSYEGIEINGSDASGNLIVGNTIGTDATGTNRLPNGMGLEFQNNSWGNTVGGPQAGAGNLVSGNNGDAIKIDGGTYNNVIQGNLVGTDVTGEHILVNYGNGVDINGNSNTIGGTTPGSGNVLSGNSGDGIVLVFSSAEDNLMEGNLIGTDITGTQNLGNSSAGIDFFFSASYNTVGGTVAGAGNIIAFNQNQGVVVGLSSTDNCVDDAILSNSIFGNNHLGVDLGDDGVTPNSPGSPHTGPNELQSFPVLNEAVAFTGLSTVVVGSLNSDPDTTFTLQFFANPTADPSGYGQGQTLLGSTTVTTDSSGNASFQVSFPVVVTAGYAISATATDPSGDTSEFAQDVFVIAAAPPVAALNDYYNTDINTTLNVAAPGVQANDVAANGEPFTSIQLTSPQHGTLTFNSNGSFTYVPKKGYTGLDSFTYDDEQNGQYSNVATVTISVNPKTLYVTNTNPTGAGSLFQAMTIAASSNSPGADTIDFDIPGSGPFMISLTQALPVITHPTIINGYSQSGAHKNSSTVGDNEVIEIQIDGANLPYNSSGIVVTGGGSTIEGLSLTRFSGDALIMEGSGDNLIAGNFVGANPSGTGYGWGNQFGVNLNNSMGNTIGGSVANRNVISANSQSGVILVYGASANVIAGNYIGTDITGVNRLSNGTGITLYDSPNNTIGGTTSATANVISGNNNDGILVSSLENGPGSTDTIIVGNYIGIDATGSIGVGNGNNGVHIVYGAGTVVGGLAAKDRNIISGNQAGVYLENSATDILIEGNYIGTDPRGFKAIGNQYDGVLLSGTLNTVGGTSAGAGNVISGNGRNGVSDGSYAGSIGLNLIEGNLIGTDSAGSVALPNGQNGVDIASYDDTVGGTAAGAGNVISGNDQYGIRISSNGYDNLVEGNYIGTAKNGTSALGNGQDGVHIQDNANNNTIGGTVAGAGNFIEFNGGAGVSVSDNAQFNPILTNSIYSNGDLGINLSGNGNQNLQPPALSSAVSKSSKTTIAGSLTGFTPNTTYLIQFFSNKTADPSGFGEGQKYLGSLQVTTDGNGNASFQVVFNTSVPVGYSISATATDPSNDTSGFAADVTVSKSSLPSPSVVSILSPAAVDAFTGVILGSLSPALNDQSDAIITDLAVDQVLAKRRHLGAAS